MSSKSARILWGQIRQKINDGIRGGQRQLPSTLTIPRDHIDVTADAEFDVTFRKDQHYFQVVVNEMYLSRTRFFFNPIDPLVYALSEFTYEGKKIIVPLLVGPAMLEKKGVPDGYADGVIYRNVSVSGLHPYRGGGLSLLIVLLEAHGDSVLRPLLNLVESVSSVLDFSPVLSPYIKVADLVMDGFNSLWDAGGVQPVVGLYDSYGPSHKTRFQPSYFALIDKPDIDPQSLWVKDRELKIGPNMKAAKPFRDADYVLYSFNTPQDNLRDDLDTLHYADLWKKIQSEAASPIDDPNYKNTRALFSTLYQEIAVSPDLTWDQADQVADQNFQRMEKIHTKAKTYAPQAGEEDLTSEEKRAQDARSKALSFLQ